MPKKKKTNNPEVKQLDGWKSRLLIERSELKDRVEKLNDFLQNPVDIDDTNKNLLIKQLASMRTYLSILEKRVEYNNL